MSFFETVEFKQYKRVWQRIQEEGGNTLKNINIYCRVMHNLLELCMTKYNCVGLKNRKEWDDFFNGENKFDYYFNPPFSWHQPPKLSQPIDYTLDQIPLSKIHYAMHNFRGQII